MVTAYAPSLKHSPFVMATCAQGLSSIIRSHTLQLPPSIRTTIFSARPHIAQRTLGCRPFSSSISRRLPSPARFPSATSGSYLTSDPVLRTVIQTREPVLLYKAPPSRKYLTRIYTMAVAATGVGLFNFYWMHELPQGLSFFVAPTYVVIGVAFLAIGLHIYQRPVRRISSLEVIPATMGGRLQLRIRARKTPFTKESVITTDVWDATLSEKTHPMVSEIVEADRARSQSIREGLEDMSIVSKGWELAARWLDQKFTSFFLKMKFAILQFGIATVEVDGVKWKIDCTGYLREEGKAIDRIIAEE